MYTTIDKTPRRLQFCDHVKAAISQREQARDARLDGMVALAADLEKSANENDRHAQRILDIQEGRRSC